MLKTCVKSFLAAGLCFCALGSANAATTPPANPPQAADKTATTTTNTNASSATDNLNLSDEALFNEINNNEAPAVAISDPMEKYNRWMYNINDHLDNAIAKPVARFYNWAMPQPLYGMVNNFFINIDTVPTVFNDILQANFYQATSDAWRLLINSTLGLGGFFNVAGGMNLQENYSDFGLTMAKWGWADSSYFVIPILGPSTVRDAGGRWVTYEMSVYPWIHNLWWQYGIYTVSLINLRAQLLKFQETLNQASLDPYVFTRNAYYQHRAFQIKRVNDSRNPYVTAETHQFADPLYIYQRAKD